MEIPVKFDWLFSLVRRGKDMRIALLALGAASLSMAGPIDYYVSETVGSNSVYGYIETDGTLGVLSGSNILGWNLTYSNGTNTSGGLLFPFTGSDLSATANQLSFNFSGGDGGVFDISDGSLDFDLFYCSSGQPSNQSCWLNGGGGEGIRINTFVSPSNEFVSQSGTQPIATMTLTPLQGGLPTAPILLPNGLGGFYGTVGGDGSESYWLFDWAGGPFSASASINDPPSAGASYLFSQEDYNGAGCGSGGPNTTLNSGDDFVGAVSIANLPAGEYCVGFDANNVNDPNFAITFNTPVGAVPEPSEFVLLSLGLATIGVLRRRYGL
jgi:hypothetical protein